MKDLPKRTVKRGPKPTPIDAKTVRALAMLGGTNKEIAEHFGVSTETLRKRHKDTLKQARADLNLQLRKLQLQSAKAGSVPMQIWLGKTMLAQTDKLDVTSTGEKLTWVDVLSTLKDEEND